MRILIADDEKNIRESIKHYLELKGFEAECAENGISAKRILQESVFQAAILDLKMPGLDGLELVRWIKAEGPAIPVIMISAYGEIEDAVTAIKLGSSDYIVKPFDPEELFLRLNRLLDEQKLLTRFQAGQALPAQNLDFIGESQSIREIKETIKTVAPTPATVLVTGASGTGKEVIARAIHEQSSSRDGPFVALNISALPETLLESELFGYEKGAFTGAQKRKSGLFEIAGHGTLFMDEIGDLPLNLQVKILRVLQERKIQHLGSTQSLPVDVRFITATNKDLEALVKSGQFREDLYYRINVIRIKVPLLKDRPDDIPLLAGYLLGKLNLKLGKKIERITPNAILKLQSYSFPGNVRELENMIERAIIFCKSNELSEKDLDIPQANQKTYLKLTRLKDLEKEAIKQVLLKWEGHREKAAAELGITRRTLLNKINEYGIET